MIRSLCLLLLLMPSMALATNFTVKPSGGNFTTLQQCADAVVAGDTCTVFAGTYAGWTQQTGPTHSGLSSARITFTVNPGDTVTLTSTVSLTNTQFITVNGFRLSLSGQRGFLAGDFGFFPLPGNQLPTTSDLIISNNTIVRNGGVAGGASNAECLYLYGNRNRIENNTCSGGGGDFAPIGGTNVVARNNTFHDVDGSTTSEHIDFFQRIGAATPALTFSLIEGNVEYNCVNQCHNVIIRTGCCGGTTSPAADTIIIRYNFSQNGDSGVSYGGPIGDGDNVQNLMVYNNTYADMADTTRGSCAGGQAATAVNIRAFNNICYNVNVGTTPFIGLVASGGQPLSNGDLAFGVGYSGAWENPYASEATYSTLRNQNPRFTNLAGHDVTLQASSPAIDAGVALTTVIAGDAGTGTTMKVADAHFFQPGWAGVNGDWIQVGTTATAQITGIDYTTNTLTLASGITRTAGMGVYLYKNSSGTIVLSGAAPDVGAAEFGASTAPPDTTPPAVPTGLQVN
jgi:hypothetical protein